MMVTEFQPFELERWQNRWEHRTRFNLAESGVQPPSVGELLTLIDTEPSELAAVRLGYTQTNGTDELRAAIAQMYPGATGDNVLVTVGSSEANFIAAWTLIETGTSVAVQLPTYQQTWGVAKSLGGVVREFYLDEAQGWELDRSSFASAVTPDTTVIAVTNPNNPTGQLLGSEARHAITSSAEKNGAWLLVDEVYRGAEREDPLTDSFWGATPRTVITGGLSKAYGLPGLRLGWLVGPADFIEEAAARHDYAVIGAPAISDFLAVRVVNARPKFFARTREILQTNYVVLEKALRTLGTELDWVPPRAGAICYVRYRPPIGTAELVETLRRESEVLIVPGRHFQQEQHLRIGFGDDRAQLVPGLEAAVSGLAGAFRSAAA